MIKEIQYGSKEYKDALALRHEVLRKPLGLNYDAKDLAAESNHLHLVAEFEGEIIGCLLLVRLSLDEVKMRQVAVAKTHQGKKTGTALVLAAEKLAREQGYKKIKLSARDTAIPFYLALQYSLVGEAYVEVGIPHHLMVKEIGKRDSVSSK